MFSPARPALTGAAGFFCLPTTGEPPHFGVDRTNTKTMSNIYLSLGTPGDPDDPVQYERGGPTSTDLVKYFAGEAAERIRSNGLAGDRCVTLWRAADGKVAIETNGASIFPEHTDWEAALDSFGFRPPIEPSPAPTHQIGIGGDELPLSLTDRNPWPKILFTPQIHADTMGALPSLLKGEPLDFWRNDLRDPDDYGRYHWIGWHHANHPDYFIGSVVFHRPVMGRPGEFHTEGTLVAQGLMVLDPLLYMHL